MSNEDDKNRTACEILGANLVRLRTQRGYSIEDVASVLGLDVETLTAYERGETSMPYSDIRRLAVTFGVPVGELFEGL